MRMGHLLLGTVLMLGFLYAAAQAKADNLLCYDYEETTVYCGGNQYCDTYTQGRCLLGGCNGNFCGTNYGFCCNRQYPSKFVSGTCRPLPDYCGDGSALEHHKLAEAETITFSEVQADAFLDPLVCDADENLYLQTEASGITGIRKLDLKGHQLAVFYPGSAPGIGPIDAVGSFSVSANGDLYELIFPHEPNRYVAAFDSSGKPKSKIKLDAGFSFTPSQIASLGSDYLLLAGMRPDGNPSVHPMRPFTGIFDSSRTLVKEVNLEDDSKIYDMAAAGDHRVVPVDKPPFFNNAVQHGKAISAPDGNAYMMRVLSPSVVYGISPAGAVVHRFTVDPGDADYIPMSMHVSGDRIAIQFRNPVTRDGRIIIVRTSGEVIASYDDPAVDGRSTFGPALACYLSNPDRFVFLTTNDSKLGLKIAKAQ